MSYNEDPGTLSMNATAKKTCGNCGASINATAQFCHACGAKQGTERKPIPPPLLGLVALVVVIVVAVVAYSAGRSSQPAVAPGGAPFAAAGATGAAPDISNLSPRQQADRLFNLVMTAHEQGDFGRVNQFASMAVQAYGILGDLDPDAHYHVGLVSAITGNAEEAMARVDSMESAVPGHLLAAMLRNSVAQVQGDSAASRAAHERFLENYQREISAGRQEYLDHGSAIEAFRQQAERRTGRSTGG
jgi:hypothetical protein